MAPFIRFFFSFRQYCISALLLRMLWRHLGHKACRVHSIQDTLAAVVIAPLSISSDEERWAVWMFPGKPKGM